MNRILEIQIEFEAILSRVRFQDWSFQVIFDNKKMYLQAVFDAKDTLTGEIEEQKSRKWLLSVHMTKSELVQTAFKCALTALEHEAREAFTYEGHRVYSPHYDVDSLVELCKKQCFDERKQIKTQI